MRVSREPSFLEGTVYMGGGGAQKFKNNFKSYIHASLPFGGGVSPYHFELSYNNHLGTSQSRLLRYLFFSSSIPIWWN